MRSTSPHALPIGTSQPPKDDHAVSASLPTWHSIESWSRREPWVVQTMTSGYPRLFVNTIIQSLSSAVLQRLGMKDGNTGCMVLPSKPAAQRLIASLEIGNAKHYVSPRILFHSSKAQHDDALHWAAFHVVLYATELSTEAMAFWCETGDGISSRHAQYALENFEYLESQSEVSSLCTRPRVDELCAGSRTTILLPSFDTRAGELAQVKAVLAACAVSDDPSQERITPSDIFLYSKGLCGIFAVSRSLVPGDSVGKSTAVIYGWPYGGTVKCVGRSGWDQVILYGKGLDTDLDDLEQKLRDGMRIDVLFCELPSNPQLASPDLHRIRHLANQYQFVVACDETLGTLINVDIIPFVDIAMTSLTKIFSGAANVMGGSVMVNPRSPFHAHIVARLKATGGDVMFPTDVSVLASNCVDFEERVRYCNQSALAAANLISKHALVSQVNYPTMVPTRHLYERYRRPTGGYGYVLSIIFHEPQAAVAFYDALDVCKGTSIGANFTLAVPYSQLVHFRELEFAAAHGVFPHIVRISVGLDETSKLLDRIRNALAAAEATQNLALDS